MLDWWNKRRYRWKGEIYCRYCGSTLKRVPLTTNIRHDALTGQKLVPKDGLMVCSNRTMESTDWQFWWTRQDRSYESGRHSMYYTDQPSL